MSAKIISFPSARADDDLDGFLDSLGWPRVVTPMYANEEEALRDELCLAEEKLKEWQERRDEIISLLREREP